MPASAPTGRLLKERARFSSRGTSQYSPPPTVARPRRLLNGRRTQWYRADAAAAAHGYHAAALILERTENPTWLSNAYLVAEGPGRKGVLIDGNDELGPLLERVESDGIDVTHVLVTHPHHDHVAGLSEARERLGGPPLVAHPDAAGELPEEVATTLADGETLSTGGLEIEAIFTPGHAAGHVAFLVNGSDLFTADVLFKGTVGGTMAPGASGFADLRDTVMRLMELPPETRVHPGHREPTTIGEEWESNPFVRIWRGLEETGEEEVTVWGRPATLKLWAPDYDGGNKAWIVFGDDGLEAIVGGSQVERA
jgi:hydroxyacylglutathione hydrolase